MLLDRIILKKAFNNFRYFPLCFLFCCSLQVIAVTVPKGFEHFTEKQTTIADIYYGGLRVGEALISYDLEEVWFEEPEKILDLISDVEKEKASIRAVLREPFARNGDKLCRREGLSVCESLKPESVGIIFNESLFRVDLFINSKLREKPSNQGKRFLDFSSSIFSSLHRISGNVSERRINQNADLATFPGNGVLENSRSRSSSLFINSIFNWNNHRIKSQYGIESEYGSRINALTYHRESRSNELEFGYMQNRNQYSSIIKPNNFFGLSWRNHLKHRVDLAPQQGSELALFLDSDSKVEVLRGKEVIAVQYLDAGNQLLQTDSFPDGAYFLELVITDSLGQERKKRQYFVKSNQLPPIGESLWLVEFGRTDNRFLQENLNVEPQNFLRIERLKRLREDLGFTLGTVVNNRQAYWYSSWDYLYHGLQFRQELGLNGRGYWQSSSRLNFDLPNVFSLALSTQKDSGKDLNYFGEVSLSANYQKQLNMAFPIGDSYIGYNYQVLSSELGRERREGLSWRYSLKPKDGGVWSLLFDWVNAVDSQTINFRFQYSFLGSSTQANVENGFLRNRGIDDVDKGSNTRLDINGRYFRDSPVQWEAGLNLQKRDGEALYRVRNGIETPFMTVDTNWQQVKQTGQEYHSYNASYAINVVSSNTNVYFGGRRGGESGVVINLKRREIDDKATFVVYADNIPMKRISGNYPVFVPIPSYKKVNIRVKQISGALVDANFKDRELSLLPGQIEHLQFKINRIYVVLGQLLDENGNRLRGVSVGNENSYHQTDDNGWFQIERNELDEIKFYRNNVLLCSVTIEPKPGTNEIIWLDDVICQSQANTSAGNSINL